MLELTVLAGSCTLELKFLAERAVEVLKLQPGERLLISSRREAFRIAPGQQSGDEGTRSEIVEQRLDQWQRHLVQLLKKS